jgi:hypothetical protein
MKAEIGDIVNVRGWIFRIDKITTPTSGEQHQLIRIWSYEDINTSNNVVNDGRVYKEKISNITIKNEDDIIIIHKNATTEDWEAIKAAYRLIGNNEEE